MEFIFELMVVVLNVLYVITSYMNYATVMFLLKMFLLKINCPISQVMKGNAFIQ